MSLWRQLSHGRRALLNRSAVDRDLDEEIRDYIERATAAHIDRGLSPAAARRAVRLEMGSVASVSEHVRSSGWEHLVETLAADARYALRRLAGAPGHSLLVTFTLALGIGATAAIFGVVKPILLEAVPYPQPDRLIVITETRSDGARNDGTFGMYRWFVERSRSVESVAVMRSWQPGLTGVGEPERVQGQRVSAGYFDVLRVPVVAGRGFAPTDDRPGDPRVVVISDRLWRRRFGSDPAILGRPITLDGVNYVVIGIMPRQFENVMAPAVDVWATLQYSMSDPRAWGHHLRTIARLRPGVAVETASPEIDSLGQAALAELRPPTYGRSTRFAAVPMRTEIARDVQPLLLTITTAVVLVLLIASVNVTNLILARSVQRRGEFALRIALGAGRTRIVRQVLVESLVLAVGGGLLGLVCSTFVLRTLLALGPAELPRVDAIRIDLFVVAVGIAVTMLLGLVVGLVPALHVARTSPNEGLQQASRRASVGHRTARSLLVVAQVAIALILLVGSGLLFRSLERLFAISPGFDASGLLSMQVQTTGPRFADVATAGARLEATLEAVRGIPGVRAAAMTSQLPLSGDRDGYGAYFEMAPDDGFPVFRYAVTPGFLETLRVPLREGRLLDRRDAAGAPMAVVISESLARQRFPDRTAVGARLRIGPADGPLYTVVGVIGDVKQLSLTSVETDAVYVTTGQWAFVDRAMSLVVRADGDVAGLAPAVRRAVWSVDPNQAIARVAPVEDLVAATAAERRFALLIFEAFAAIALALAAAGIYAVLATTVAERTREIGVRTALGATRAVIVRSIVRSGVTLAGAGVAIGLAAAAALSGVLTSLLFSISPLDPLTYVTVAAAIIVVAVLASGVPAWRAARLDPVTTLRAE